MKRPEGSLLELKVGLFVLLGMAVLAWMTVQFAGLGGSFREYDSIQVEFPDASGLLKDSAVLLAGARIGRVTEEPEIVLVPSVLEKGPAVLVTMEVFQEARIPVGSRFVVGSAGLLGDRFVGVNPPAEMQPGQYIAPGSKVAGSREMGLQDLTVEGSELIDGLKEVVANINDSVLSLDEKFLNDQTAQDFAATLASLRKTSESFERASGNIEAASDKLDGILKGADSAVATGGKTLEEAQAAAAELRAGIGELREVIGRANELVASGLTGDGLLAALLSDRQIADNVRAASENLRKHGLLFYRDRAAQGEPPKESEGTQGRERKSGGPRHPAHP